MSRPILIRSSVWIHVLVITIFCYAISSALGQGFMVKPMKMEVSAKPGESIEIPLDLTNSSPDSAKTLEVSVLEVTQSTDGSWLPVDKGSKIDTSKLSSCAGWVKLSSQNVTIKPSETGRVMVSIKVPANARGCNFAAIIAQTAMPKDIRGVVVVVRFLIPLIVEIQGRPERRKIEFEDLEMSLLEKGNSKTASVLVKVNNEGRTFSRISGNVKINYFAKNRWLNVANVNVRETGIIPASQLKLPADLGRSLPAGKYKLTANMTIDSRRVKPIEKEIDFVGDPSVAKLALDTALILDPSEIVIAGVGGATRTASLKIQNASEDPIQVKATSLIPPPMTGVALGDIKGDDFSCASWIEVVPAQFTIRPGAKQNVRVIAKVPSEFTRPGYFALLSLKAQYEDGQSAGETQSMVYVENKKVEPNPAAQIMNMTLMAGEASKYIVQAKFGNIGDCRMIPKATVSLLGPDGKSVGQDVFSGTESAMLPLETRTCSAELDFNKVNDGRFTLRATLNYGQDKTVAQSLPLVVTTENGQKIVTVVTNQEPGATSQAIDTQPGVR